MPRASRLLTSSSVAAMMTAPVPVTAKVLTCSGGSRRSQKEEEEGWSLGKLCRAAEVRRRLG